MARSKEEIYLFQRKYVLDLLKGTGMLGSKPTKTPIDLNHKLNTVTDGALMDKKKVPKNCGKINLSFLPEQKTYKAYYKV